MSIAASLPLSAPADFIPVPSAPAQLSGDASSAAAAFYGNHARAYFDSTAHLDMSDIRGRFLWHMPPGAQVLDAGCGSGRDAVAFGRAGCHVEAFDASSEMAGLARAHTGLDVQTKTFAELDDLARFDGVWACASLVHLEPEPLADALRHLSAALRPTGWLYTSFKLGNTPYVDSKNRPFNRQTVAGAKALLAGVGLDKCEVWLTPNLAEPGTQWVNLLATRRGSGTSG